MTPFIIVALLIFLAAGMQTISGFGFALLAMPLMTLLLGLRTAAPLIALAGLTLYTVNLFRYRRAINWREVLKLVAASAPGVLVGIWVLDNVEESIIRVLLGGVLILYALYRFYRPTAQRTVPKYWVFPTGFLAGCLGGAYNTPGPPIIVYGTLRQWTKASFKAVLQATFLVNGILVVSSHFLARNVTPLVLNFYVWAAPALLLGVWGGARIDARLNRRWFELVVTLMILLLGGSMVVSVLF